MKLPIILVGYPGSQVIVPASKYLTSKYLPGFDITYLNYKGEINGWSKYLCDYLSTLTDENIIFALDDYLIADYLNVEKYESALSEIGGDVVCVKLCKSTLEEHAEYPVTTQYTIWNREYLIWLLRQVKTPWEFEIQGSRLFNKKVLLRTCLDYFCNSSISGRWEGINISGLKKEDIETLQSKGYLPTSEKTTSVDIKSTNRIVVFGASGFLGQSFIGRLIEQGNKNILAVARNEQNLVMLREKYPSIEIQVGDIANRYQVRKAMQGSDEVYLFSALKHIGIAEKDVMACTVTNIHGVSNVIEESVRTKPKLLLFTSTDKAARPTGVYGCTKKIGERLMAEAANINPDTKYRVIRYGNVLGSSGSFITKWKPKMMKGEEIILTDPEASRFFFTVDEAIDLIFECVEKHISVSPYIPKMKAATLQVALEACQEVYGNCPVRIIGLQPGENKVETTDGITFSDQVEQFTKSEFIEKFLKNI